MSSEWRSRSKHASKPPSKPVCAAYMQCRRSVSRRESRDVEAFVIPVYICSSAEMPEHRQTSIFFRYATPAISEPQQRLAASVALIPLIAMDREEARCGVQRYFTYAAANHAQPARDAVKNTGYRPHHTSIAPCCAAFENLSASFQRPHEHHPTCFTAKQPTATSAATRAVGQQRGFSTTRSDHRHARMLLTERTMSAGCVNGLVLAQTNTVTQRPLRRRMQRDRVER